MSRVLELHAIKPTHPSWNAPCLAEPVCARASRYVVFLRRGNGTQRVAACASHARALADRDGVPIPAGVLA